MPVASPGTQPVAGAARPRHVPLYNVVLLDDDDHTYEYVVEMLMRLFHFTRESAYRTAVEVDTQGRAIVATTLLERAELMRDQIHAFGADWRLERSAGSMTAVLEKVAG
jgi:ATP-dependent Clp protease adaptor protein ClpS